jgi:acetoin utilization protein AcuC
MPAAASGFCIYTDLVVGIRHARAAGLDRVLYVDFDVHHGDGVEFAFAADPSVMTVSFHEDPAVRFPGTGRITDMGIGDGRGSVVNMPLASGTGDASWLDTVRRVFLPLARRFRPQLIVSQHGCDPHFEDPLADLRLTTQAMVEAARLTAQLATELCDGRWVATGGGGYQPVRVLPRVWAAVWAVMSGRPVPERIAPGWIERWQHRSPEPLCATFADPPRAAADGPREERAAAVNARTVDELLALHV